MKKVFDIFLSVYIWATGPVLFSILIVDYPSLVEGVIVGNGVGVILAQNVLVRRWVKTNAILELASTDWRRSSALWQETAKMLRVSNHGLRMQVTELIRMTEFHRDILAMRIRVHTNGIVIHEHNIRTAYGIARGRDGRARYTLPEGAILDYVLLEPVAAENLDAQQDATAAITRHPHTDTPLAPPVG